MKNSVIIKSFPNGIVLHLNPEIDFDELLTDIVDKFRESNSFFKDAKMALSIKGRNLTEEEEEEILNAISENSQLHIICLVSEDEEANQNFIRALKQTDFFDETGISSGGQFYRGTLKNGQVLETESSIVVLGDVYPGATIISTGDIIILGGLYGKAYAGEGGNGNRYVVALEMSPERLKIGDFKYRAKGKSSKWPIRPKVQPKIAYIKDKEVVMDPLTKELLSELPI
ncbi:septum site-determining protein MinC [Parablautia intestinalis]|uniref:Probable septum site-determining protein MinC n=1 Tax=Parablautia intestinalis TaxID=2320100 RepID=A0A3A9AMY0_9FIRM|nr:septum site-determining protein MinC [Parablautia intestinalis]MCI8614424.1 septum site-determining protein MinC [Lachnospiraceae bacterium]MDE7048248.1 septum site-determining protein MinC [Lachnospiraceae bacterium]RKI92747.1 septum site-determining protein MinC [Parablautia intestinalis]